MAGAWDDSLAVLQDNEELQVLYKTLDSFYQYRRQSHFNITHRRRQNFYALPAEHQRILTAQPFNILDRLDAVDNAISFNAQIADHILLQSLRTFDFEGQDGIVGNESWQSTCDVNDLTKASTVINQFYRDWSVEGHPEREMHYGPVLNDLESVFGQVPDKSSLKILVPGAGLGRLVFDICLLGYDVEGNEISYHALLASNWIMNTLGVNDHFTLYPFASRFSNQYRFEEQMKSVVIPDIHVTAELLEGAGGRPRGSLSMSASDFLTAYRQPEQGNAWDAVVTVFFIDTAPNLLRYIETISHTLKPGGYWMNLGPLLWHFEDKPAPPAHEEGAPMVNGGGLMVNGGGHSNRISGIEEPGSIELTCEDIVHLIERMGFEICFMERREANLAGYIQQPTSMLLSVYKLFHFVARKL